MKKLLPFLVFAVTAPAWVPSVLATKAETVHLYLKIAGSKTSKFNPEVGSDKIMVIAVSHEIVSPRDPASGQATGKRMHKPFVIMKELDKSTPLLYQALVTNEQIKEVVFEAYRPAGAGKVTVFKSGKLENARIKSIQKSKRPNGKEFETISFTYEKITWTEMAPRTQGANDWKNG